MFKKREKKIAMGALDGERQEEEGDPQRDSGDEDNIHELIREKMRSRTRVTANDRYDRMNENMFNQNDQDMNEFLHKRPPPTPAEPADSLNDRLNEYIKNGAAQKLTDIFESRAAPTDGDDGDPDSDIKKLSKYEELSKQIKDEVKQKAYWSVGMLEVDIGVEKKIANIEATELEKKNRLIQEYVKTAAKSILRNRGAKTAENKNAPTEDIKNWIWKPKDISQSIKLKDRKELDNLVKAFERSGKIYAKKKLLGEMGVGQDRQSEEDSS